MPPSDFGTPVLATAGTDLSLQTVELNQSAAEQESYDDLHLETFDGEGKTKPTGCVPTNRFFDEITFFFCHECVLS